MSRKNKLNPRKTDIRSVGTKDDRSIGDNKFITLSFKYFDRSQGQSFEDWEKGELLAKAIEKLAGLTRQTYLEANRNGLFDWLS